MTKLPVYRREALGSKVLQKTVNFGLYRPAGPVRETFYLLHGGNGDDQQFHQVGCVERLPAGLLDELAGRGAQLVLPYVGSSCLHAHPTDPARDYSRYFFNELMPAAEAGTATQDSSRWIAGLSMGGQAALNGFLRFPRIFAGVGAHFPTLIAFDAWDDSACASFQRRMGVEDGWFGVLKNDLRTEFTGKEDFSAHDPLRLAAQVSPGDLRGKPVYFDVGSRDAFGLQEGCEAFSALLAQRGISHEYRLVDGGGHDADFVNARFEHMIGALLGAGRVKASPAAGAPLRREAGANSART